MMKILKEITDWGVEYRQPNHTYLLNSKNQIVAYAKWHGDDIDILKSKTVLDKRYRKFIEVNHSGLSEIKSQYKEESNNQEEYKPDYDRIFKVKSKEKEYIVGFKNNQLTCSCTGFGYRRKCKHVDVVKKQHFPSA